MSGRPHLQTQEQSTPSERFLEAAEKIAPNYQDRLSVKMIEKLIFQKKFLFGSDFYMVLNEDDIHDIMVQFYEVFDGREDLIQALTVDNPKRFLFPE